jgi:hypothetical protein
MSGLYRTFKNAYVPYFSDGRGRDWYIAYNNAGFFHDFPKSLSPTNTYKTGTFFGTKIIHHNKSPSVKAPNFHYHSDGNGRDKYILINGGGLYYDTKPLISYKLTDFLRKNDLHYNSSNKKRITLSRDELKYNKLLRSKEKELIKRLYHNEKQKFMKKKKYDPKNWFSSDEIKNDCDDNINTNKTSTYYLSNCKNLKKSLNEVNQSLTPKNKMESYKSLNNENGIKYKPKLFIKAENNNKDNIFSKNNYNFSYKTSKDFFNDIQQIKKYQTIQNKNKNLIKFKKPPYLHILNEQCVKNQNE